jgi:two-component system, LytTR family, response regulator
MTRPWRAVAVDDEPPALRRLRDLLAPHGEIEIVGEYADPAEALDGIAALRPDLAFLDIQMPGMTGLELARALGPRAPLVVFVTAFDQHALAAFEVHAFDYLLKPVDPSRLRATLARVAERLAAPGAGDVQARLEALAWSIEVAAGGAARRVSFRVGGGTQVVHADEIDRVEVEEDHLRIHLPGRTLLVRETLASLQERLPAGMFVRVHRSHLVNAARVRELRPWFGGDYVLVLADGTEITTGRTHRADVRRAFVAP